MDGARRRDRERGKKSCNSELFAESSGELYRSRLEDGSLAGAPLLVGFWFVPRHSGSQPLSATRLVHFLGNVDIGKPNFKCANLRIFGENVVEQESFYNSDFSLCTDVFRFFFSKS